MKVEYVNPFIEAAFKVLRAELGCECQRGEISLLEQPIVSGDVTVVIGVAGAAQGLVLYDMDRETALNIVSTMMAEKVEEFDELSESAIGELGNVITGLASAGLLEQGYSCNIAPPTVVMGHKPGEGTVINAFKIKRLVVPIITPLGEIRVHIALGEA